MRRRLAVACRRHRGRTAERAAEALFSDAETVRPHRRLYAASGRAGVERLACAGHEPVLSAAQAAELSAELPSRFHLTAKAVRDRTAKVSSQRPLA